ncbi:universal stress protein [Streptomyces sp. WG-D5]
MTGPHAAHPVVVGVDASVESGAAVLWAAREAARRDAPLHLVHAWNWSPHPSPAEAEVTGQRRRAEELVRSAAQRAAAENPLTHPTSETLEGPATTALLAAAEHAGVLVLGSRGLGALSGLLVGSVAAGVVGRAPCPVVLVRADTEPSADGLDVVIGLDLDDPCDDVIDYAFEDARRRACRLQVVSAWRGPNPLSVGPGEVALARGALRGDEWNGFQEAVLSSWREKYPDVEVVRTVVEGRAQAPLLGAAAGAGLVVVGRRRGPEPRLAPRTGPVAHAVVHHAPCPVAVVPHD